MTRRDPFEDSLERSPRRSAIIAVIDSPEWDEDEEVEKEIREAFGEDTERETEHEEDNGVVRVLPSTSEEETSGTALACRTFGVDSLPQVTTQMRRSRTSVPTSPDFQMSIRSRRQICIAAIASSFPRRRRK